MSIIPVTALCVSVRRHFRERSRGQCQGQFCCVHTHTHIHTHTTHANSELLLLFHLTSWRGEMCQTHVHLRGDRETSQWQRQHPHLTTPTVGHRVATQVIHSRKDTHTDTHAHSHTYVVTHMQTHTQTHAFMRHTHAYMSSCAYSRAHNAQMHTRRHPHTH